MKNTTEVPNQLLIDAHKEACQKWKTIIEELNPELFKPKFKVGDWVKFECDENIKRIETIRCGNVIFSNDSSGTTGLLNDGSSYRLATPSEIESHLIKVAGEKGFKEGVGFFSPIGDNLKYNFKKNFLKWTYSHSRDALFISNCGNGTVYCDGKWATIISEPLELTLDEVAKKFGVESVKIKK